MITLAFELRNPTSTLIILTPDLFSCHNLDFFLSQFQFFYRLTSTFESHNCFNWQTQASFMFILFYCLNKPTHDRIQEQYYVAVMSEKYFWQCAATPTQHQFIEYISEP